MTDELSNDYGAETDQSTRGLEAVRKRPAMYIGSTSVQGLHHLVYEVVDNSIDEALPAIATSERQSTWTVRHRVDNGRGIPPTCIAARRSARRSS